MEAICFTDVYGQEEAIAKIEAAVACRAWVNLWGSPGAGKTMLARRIPGIIPLPTEEEHAGLMATYVAARLTPPAPGNLPFRAPHHTVSDSGLFGGSYPHRDGTERRIYGEIDFAEYGVLYLDEYPEFRACIQNRLAQFVTTATIVTSSNPCPCGYKGHPTVKCMCPNVSINRYAKRWPKMPDVVDVEVPSVDPSAAKPYPFPSVETRRIIATVREIMDGLVEECPHHSMDERVVLARHMIEFMRLDACPCGSDDCDCD